MTHTQNVVDLQEGEGQKGREWTGVKGMVHMFPGEKTHCYDYTLSAELAVSPFISKH